MNMESDREIGSKQISQAKHLFMRYVLMLVIVYIGFVIMTELLEQRNESVRIIEFGLFAVIMVVLGITIYKIAYGLRLIKKSEEWR